MEMAAAFRQVLLPCVRTLIISCFIFRLTNLQTEKFEGPWFTTQLSISFTIGIISFFVFSYSRTRWPLVFAPRTKLKGMNLCNTWVTK